MLKSKNTIKAHIEDGVALTKFLYWFKMNKKKLLKKNWEQVRKKEKGLKITFFQVLIL